MKPVPWNGYLRQIKPRHSAWPFREVVVSEIAVHVRTMFFDHLAGRVMFEAQPDRFRLGPDVLLDDLHRNGVVLHEPEGIDGMLKIGEGWP